jgi:hypothetical protein
MPALLSMIDRVDTDQYYFLTFKCLLSSVPDPVNVLSQSESISFPQKWCVGKEDVDLVGNNDTVKRAVVA